MRKRHWPSPDWPRRQAGLTLMEMVITIVILAIALVTLTAAISMGIGRSADTLVETRAIALGQSYLEEIMSRRFDEHSAPNGIPPCHSANAQSPDCTAVGSLGPDAGEADREAYDDVDDYHGLDQGYGQAGPVLAADGGEREAYDNFRVRVEVRYLEPQPGGAEAALGAAPDDLDQAEDAKLVTVTINHREGGEWLFSAYKANF